MAAGWTWPLLTSVLRLVFISTLTVVNWAALYRVVSSKKYKAGQRQERLLVTTIIVVSLVYLTVVWAPFTFSALKHDLSDLQQQKQDVKVDLESNLLFPKPQNLEGDIILNAPKNLKEDEFTVEYIDLVPSLEVFQDVGDEGRDEFTVEYVDLVPDSEEQSINNDVEEEFILEYVDIATGETVEKIPPKSRKSRSTQTSGVNLEASGGNLEAEWTVFFHSQPDFQPDISFSPAEVQASIQLDVEDEGRAATLSWNSDVQDFVTSSCAYSLAFTAVVRMVFMRRFSLCPDGDWVVGVWAGLVVGVPAAITLLVRNLARTSTHFAPHEPEYTSAGYFLYNIICDVHISEEYVVSVFLEWAALFTLLMVVLAVIFACAVRSKRADLSDSYGPLHQEGNSSGNVETWARDVVLTVGAIWSWPAKPVLVLVLFCVYGSHWTNVVCWMAHVVVAIPVVFIPLAVFLTRSHQEKSPMDIYVIDQDPHLTEEEAQNEGRSPKEVENEGIPTHYLHGTVEKVQNTAFSNNMDGGDDLPDAGDHEPMERQGDDVRGHAKENLKFYLGKDIFKYGLKPAKEEDKQIILDNEWGETSISEA